MVRSAQVVRLAVSAAAALVVVGVSTGCASPVDVTAGAPTAATDRAASPIDGPSSTTAVPSTPPSPATPTADPAPASQAAPAIGVEPASISVPALGIAQPLIPLGLESDGSMEVPDDFFDIGWFTGGGRPGGTGPVVIAGHVDSVDGAAVFYRLSELVTGDRLDVTGVDGVVATYEVYRIEDLSKAGFPTALVFGATMKDEVRLVTCSGPFDAELRDYTKNLVVFASRVG